VVFVVKFGRKFEKIAKFCDFFGYNTIQYNIIQYNTIQYNTIQYNTMQYNTIQYNTIQYNMINLWFLWWNLGGNLKKWGNLVVFLDTI